MLVYFEDERGLPIVIVAGKITALQQKRLPSETPVIVWLGADSFQVRGSFDDAQARLIAALTKEATNG